MNLHYLQDVWNDAETVGMDEPELLRYRSNLLGRDLRLTNFGGGNTSAKIPMNDPVTGETVEVLWVKGSGGDLGTIKRDGFATLYMDKLIGLKRRYKGIEAEDEMPDLYPLCTFNNNPRAASIDTPLHGFLPFPHVDHLHPDWAIALAACANGPAQLERLHEETGIKLVWVPWKRPGFELGLWLEKALHENPGIDGIILGSHGLFTWGETGRQSYLNTLRVIDAIGVYVQKRVEAKGDQLFGGAATTTREDASQLAADVIPVLRGLVGSAIGHFANGPDVMRFVNSADAKTLAWQGTSCPDHFVRTKVRPLYVEWDAKSGSVEHLVLAARHGMEQYKVDYAAYYEDNKLTDSPAMRATTPTVILVPGVGLFSFGRSKPEARITGEFYINAIHVMEGATCLGDLPVQPGIPEDRVVDNYVALSPREAFNIEYWLLEEAKLKRMPPEKELSRKVALVIGVSPGIGQTTAERLAREGAHVVTADINPDMAKQAAAAVRKIAGTEVAHSEAVDCTDRDSVRRLMQAASLQFGGVDLVVVIAAVFLAPEPTPSFASQVFAHHNTDAQWRKTYEVNVFGSLIVSEEAYRVMVAQGTPGSIVLTTSANAVVSKKGSLAYDTSKAAVAHLVRELAVEFAPLVRVNAVAPASVVEGSLMFPRERVIGSLAKYNLSFEESETTEALRDKLAHFYAGRTLLKRKVTPVDIAEAAFLLVSERLGKTTGQTLPVDAGLAEAFLR